MDVGRLISKRCREIDASGIRRVFELGAKLKDPINLSIGQPDFPVPETVKRAAIEAISKNENGYTLTTGIPALRKRIAQELVEDVGWPGDAGEPGSAVGAIVSAGTSGALHLAMLALLSPGDEIIIPDPYFVAYPHMARICDGVPVFCDTYPDFRMTAARIEPLMTSRTRAVLLNSPGNPSGVVMSQRECEEVLELCRSRGVVLISDEIYDRFCFADALAECRVGRAGRRCPSPARVAGAHECVLLIRGFGKTYGCTGWRMGYAAGPRRLIDEMTKMQQYSFVCAPAPLQHGCLATFDCDMTPFVVSYARKRDEVMRRLAPLTEVVRPGGAFYAFVQIPARLGMTGRQFCDAAIERNLLLIPGEVFSRRDTHFRLSFATSDGTLQRGLDVLTSMMHRA